MDPIKVGPRGDTRSDTWCELHKGDVRQIFISHGDAINSIQVLYDSNGNLALADRHGGEGDDFVSITFKSWEHLTSLTGYFGPIKPKGSKVVRSLTFETNRAIYGPYGRKEGTPFRFDFQTGVKFGGFHGRSNDYHLTAIGVYVKTLGKQ